MLLWVDASFHAEKPPVAAIAAVDPESGFIHIAKLVDAKTSADAEREAVVAAFRLSRTIDGPVVIRTDCTGVAKLQPPQGTKLQHHTRKGNLAHAVARRVAREELARRAQQKREAARRNKMPQALRSRPQRPAA